MLPFAVLAATVAAASGTVHLTGTAYEFNNTKVVLGGAQIRVAEDPTLGATVKPDGTYDLAVPAGRRITPYINAAGHHTIYLQTFTTVKGYNLEHVNFQTPSDAIYGALAALLQVPVGADGNPQQCAVVSTFSTRNVRALDYQDFTGYGAHGVAGATASAAPALPAPVYFNRDVIPDRSQPKSSADGGVIWPVVGAGTYTFTAHAPRTRFASFTATCAPGRIVNANPPWGLHELGLPNPTRFNAKTYTLTKLPKGARIAVTSGRITATTKVNASRLVLAAVRHIGRTMTIDVTAGAYDGLRLTFTPRAGRTPAVTKTTLPLGGGPPER
jgi:hypothetical protein